MSTKRNSSDSSVLSDHHGDTERNPAKKVNTCPLIAPDEVPEEMPAWARIFVSKFNDLNNSIQYIGKNVDEALSKTKSLEKKIGSLEHCTNDVKLENAKLKVELDDLREKQSLMEIELRKCNVVFKGIGEDKHENCVQKVSTIIGNMKNTAGVEVLKSYRLGQYTPGRTRDLLVHLNSEDAKYQLFNNKKTLQDGISIRDDIPSDVYEKRKELMSVFKLAKASEAYAKTTKFKGTKLKIGRTFYTQKNLHQLPPDLSPANSCSRDSSTSHVFFGKFNPLSNFYECDIVIEGQKYRSSKHFIQEQKANLFGDFDTAKLIKSSKTPREAKTHSYNIRNFDSQLWASSASEYVETALKNKFAQNEYCRTYLLRTGSKKLGEATKDLLWGTGQLLTSPDALNAESWNGRNLMGRTLEMIRSELQP